MTTTVAARCAAALCILSFALATGLPRAGAAQPTTAVTTLHPIFAAIPDLPQGDEAHARFVAAAKRFRLGPVEVMDVPASPAPRAPALLKLGRTAVEEKKFGEAEAALDEAAADVNARGGAGLSASDLAEVFLYLGMAAQKADWKDVPRPLTAIEPAESPRGLPARRRPGARQAAAAAPVPAPGDRELAAGAGGDRAAPAREHPDPGLHQRAHLDRRWTAEARHPAGG